MKEAPFKEWITSLVNQNQEECAKTVMRSYEVWQTAGMAEEVTGGKVSLCLDKRNRNRDLVL